MTNEPRDPFAFDAPLDDPLAPPPGTEVPSVPVIEPEPVVEAIAEPEPEPEVVVDEQPEEALTGFAALGLGPKILSRLDQLGYAEPTPIQAESIMPLLTGVDLLGQAATGTGKTAAFALPILEKIGDSSKKIPRALVLTPTRELAVQVSEAFQEYGQHLGIEVLAVFGGQPIHRQLRALDRPNCSSQPTSPLAASTSTSSPMS